MTSWLMLFDGIVKVNSVVKHITIGAESLGFDSWSSQIGRSVAIAAMFHRSCVAQALRRVGGFRRFDVIPRV